MLCTGRSWCFCSIKMVQYSKKPPQSTFTAISVVNGSMAIWWKWEHLHSYNSQKCINDHHGRGLGGKKANNILFHMKVILPVSLKLFIIPNNCQRRQNYKPIIGKHKNFKSFFLSYKAHCAKEGGSGTVTCSKCSRPSFPGFQCLGKSSHFMSTVLQHRNKQVSSWTRKHKIFQCLWDMMNSLGGCVPVYGRTPPD